MICDLKMLFEKLKKMKKWTDIKNQTSIFLFNCKEFSNLDKIIKYKPCCLIFCKSHFTCLKSDFCGRLSIYDEKIKDFINSVHHQTIHCFNLYIFVNEIEHYL